MANRHDAQDRVEANEVPRLVHAGASMCTGPIENASRSTINSDLSGAQVERLDIHHLNS